MPIFQNPYGPMPKSAVKNPGKVFDSQSLSVLIRSYLSLDIDSFQFVNELEPYLDSDDPVAQHVADTLWLTCIDGGDEIFFVKSDWDYVQRLLLLLESKGRVENETKFQWSPRQILAATSLCIVCVSLFSIGWGVQILFYLIPTGIISIFLATWSSSEPEEGPYRELIAPFATFSDLANAYKKSGFRKMKFPREHAVPGPPSALLMGIFSTPFFLIWIFFSPLVLFFQTLPRFRSETLAFAST